MTNFTGSQSRMIDGRQQRAVLEIELVIVDEALNLGLAVSSDLQLPLARSWQGLLEIIHVPFHYGAVKEQPRTDDLVQCAW
jgi:hypothetical protein